MNWLLLLVLLFMGYHVYDGFRKGFIRKAVSAVSLILTLVLVTCLTPYITNFIQNHTPVYDNLQKKCSEMFFDESYSEDVKTDQVLMIENMSLPENIKEILLENNNLEAYASLGVSKFQEYIGAYLANLILNAMSYLITFLIVWVVLRVIMLALDLVAKLPLLRGVNQLAGGAMGLFSGVMLVWVAFLLVTILCNGELGRKFFDLINESQFLLFLYNQNVIMKIVYGLIF